MGEGGGCGLCEGEHKGSLVGAMLDGLRCSGEASTRWCFPSELRTFCSKPAELGERLGSGGRVVRLDGGRVGGG